MRRRTLAGWLAEHGEARPAGLERGVAGLVLGGGQKDVAAGLQVAPADPADEPHEVRTGGAVPLDAAPDGPAVAAHDPHHRELHRGRLAQPETDPRAVL